MAVIEPKLTVNDLALLPDDGKRYELHERELLVSTAPNLFPPTPSFAVVGEVIVP